MRRRDDVLLRATLNGREVGREKDFDIAPSVGESPQGHEAKESED